MPELRSHLGRHQPARLDLDAENRTGSHEHRILVVAEQDPRLSWLVREVVQQVGAKLYGADARSP